MVLVGWVYWPALGGDFVYDDELLFGPTNEATSSIGAAFSHAFEPLWSFDRPSAAGAAGQSLERSFWRPLTVLALALGRALPGGGALGPHIVSLLLHLAATLIAWRLAARLLGHTLAGFCVAALFAVHPVQAESVAWAAAVNDPLAGALVLAALLAHVRWRACAALTGDRDDARGTPLLGGVCALLALLAKEQALVVPLLVIGVDLALGRRPSRRSLAPYLVALALWYLARAFIFRDVFAGLRERQGDFGFADLAREVSFRVELVGGFLSLLAWPTELAVFRPVRPVLPAGDASVVHGALWIAGFGAALGVALWRRARAVVFGLGVALVAPLLVAAALHTAGRYPLSDRYLYVSAFGAALALIGALWRVAPRALSIATLAGVALFAIGKTRGHLAAFADSDAFHASAVTSAPRDPYVQVNAGRAGLKAYQRTLDLTLLLDAYRHFLLSLTLGTDYGARQIEDDPSLPLKERVGRLEQMMLASERRPDPTVFWTPYDRLEANLGQLYVHLYASDNSPLEDFTAPLEIAEQLTSFFGHEARVWTAKGQVHQKRGEFKEAEEAYNEALRRNPADTLAWRQLANVQTELRRDGDARRSLDQALAYAPNDITLLEGALAAALREGQLAVAESYLARVVAAAPGTREAAYWTGRVLIARDRYTDALGAFDRALALDPGWGEALKHKGFAQARLQDATGALESLSDAARALPDDFEVHYQIAALMGLVVAAVDEDPNWKAQRLGMLKRAYELSPPTEHRVRLQNTLLPYVAGNPDSTFSLATGWELRRDLFSARFWLDRTVEAADGWPADEHDANLAAALTRLGSIMRQMDELDGALATLARATDLAPHDFEALFERATTLRVAKRIPEAGAIAQRALAAMERAKVQPELRDAALATLKGWIAEAEALNAVGPLPPPARD